MDTVCEKEMAFEIFLNGGVGCIHRFMTIGDQAAQVKWLHQMIYGDGNGGPFEDWGVMFDDWHSEIDLIPIMAAIGVQEEDKERALALVEHGANILLIDVAHGHHQKVYDMIKWCKANLPGKIDIVAGSIATKEAAEFLQEAGADGLRVGIGGGSLCTTRIQTGFGIPNVTSLIDVVSVAKVPVIADGGIRTSGDIAKALALGASSVMLGSLLAGTKESPGNLIEGRDARFYKKYRGSASAETKTSHNQVVKHIEGESTLVPYKFEARQTFTKLTEGLQSALSYDGAHNLNSFHPEWITVTSAGQNEAKPHLL
jgi:IMP dehydrogenase